MHPSLIFFIWLCAVLLVQRISLFYLLPALFLLTLFSGFQVRRHASILLYRARWLFIVLILTFLFLTPGERVIPGYPITWEGGLQALDHASRLITVLFAVAWLLVKLPLPCLLAALLGLARLSGVEKLQQAVLRLALVLQYVERGELGHWQRLLTDEVDNFPVSLTISVRKISYQEFCLAGLALALTIGIWLK